jgi:ABC-type glycerol-3-phosphate transport system substrate-binding protein
MEAAARKLADESAGRWGFYVDLPSGQLYQNFVYSHGATILNADGTKHELNDPKLIAGLEWMADMIHKRRLAPKPAERPGNAWDNLAQKKVAMFLAGAWNIPQTEQAVKGAFKWSVLPPPSGPAGAITGDAANDNWSIPAPATAAEAAWLYMKWFCEDQQLIDWMRLWGGNPTARPKLNETHYAAGELAEYRRPHIAQLQSGKYRGAPTPKNQRQVDLKNRLLPPKLAEVWTGTKSVRQALQELDAPVTALLAEPLQGS